MLKGTSAVITLQELFNRAECAGESVDPLFHCLGPKPPIKMINGAAILPAVIYEKRQQTETRGGKAKKSLLSGLVG